MENVLLITIIGMSLVFFAILLLWGMMELLVRVTNGRAKPVAVPVEEPEGPVNVSLPAENNPVSVVDKRKVAAVAVAAALRIRRKQAAVLAVRSAIASDGKAHLPAAVGETDFSHSNWQPVMRAARMQNRLRLFSRNQRRSSS